MKYILVPLEPTPAILREMRRATFLKDGSNLEMHRRYNGVLEAARRMKINSKNRKITW